MTAAALQSLLAASLEQGRQLCLFDASTPGFSARTPVTADGNFTFFGQYQFAGAEQHDGLGEGRQDHLAEDLAAAMGLMKEATERFQLRGAVFYPDAPYEFDVEIDDK